MRVRGEMGPPPVETPQPVHVNTIAYWVFATTVTGLLKVEALVA